MGVMVTLNLMIILIDLSGGEGDSYLRHYEKQGNQGEIIDFKRGSIVIEL